MKNNFSSFKWRRTTVAECAWEFQAKRATHLNSCSRFARDSDHAVVPVCYIEMTIVSVEIPPYPAKVSFYKIKTTFITTSSRFPAKRFDLYNDAIQPKEKDKSLVETIVQERPKFSTCVGLHCWSADYISHFVPVLKKSVKINCLLYFMHVDNLKRAVKQGSFVPRQSRIVYVYAPEIFWRIGFWNAQYTCAHYLRKRQSLVFCLTVSNRSTLKYIYTWRINGF